MSKIELKARELLASQFKPGGPCAKVAMAGSDTFTVGVVRAMAAALAPQWQPIESAPKDGTPILACYAPHYETNGFLPVAVRWRAYHPNARGNEEWRDSSGAKVRAITHWHPLPAPPEVEG